MAANQHNAYIVDAIRTPIGRYGGGLSSIRADDLAALPIKALIERSPHLDWSKLDEVILGSANQAGEDNRNVARMAALLAGLPQEIPGLTVNRLCASGMDAVAVAARGIKAEDYDLVLAGGVESMSRAPFVLPKSTSPFSRKADIYDTTIGWRFVNPKMKAVYGVDSMPETADNVAEDWSISRQDQDAFALRSQQKWAKADAEGRFEEEILPVSVPQRRGDDLVINRDEHPRPDTSLEKLEKLKGINGPDLTVTAGNASGVNDGACALLLASDKAVSAHDLKPMAQIIGVASAGVAPRVMGIGPAPASKKLLDRTGLSIDDMDIIELNEAFASQALASMRDLGIADDDPRVNPNGGAIAMGHPLGMTGARLVLSAAYQLRQSGKSYALCSMCVGVGQGTALLLKRV